MAAWLANLGLNGALSPYNGRILPFSEAEKQLKHTHARTHARTHTHTLKSKNGIVILVVNKLNIVPTSAITLKERKREMP